jgi:uncharacterized protein YkwD
MFQCNFARCARRFAAPGLAAHLLAGCVSQAPVTVPVATAPDVYRGLARPGAKLDLAAAQELISSYRARNGLPAVSIDPRLTAIAEAQAQAMASADQLSHALPGRGDFTARLRAGGFRTAVAAENVGAGHYTLAEAFGSWRGSRSHDANMLLGGATRMGIAIAHAPRSKCKVYWALVLAAPESEAPAPGGPFGWGAPIR